MTLKGQCKIHRHANGSPAASSVEDFTSELDYKSTQCIIEYYLGPFEKAGLAERAHRSFKVMEFPTRPCWIEIVG